jgi:hypothetical protein
MLLRLKHSRAREQAVSKPGFVSQAAHATASPTQSPERSDGSHTGFVSQNPPAGEHHDAEHSRKQAA